MGATMATAYGEDKARTKETHRLGSRAAHTKAATWRTFVTASVWKDGTLSVEVRRDGAVLHAYRLDVPETDTPDAAALDRLAEAEATRAPGWRRA